MASIETPEYYYGDGSRPRRFGAKQHPELAMQISDIRAQTGLDKIPPFSLTDADRSKFQKFRLQDRSGRFIHLSNSDVDRIEVALRILMSVDYIENMKNEACPPLKGLIEDDIKLADKHNKHLRGLVNLLHRLNDRRILECATRLYMLDRADHGPRPSPDEGNEVEQIREICRTIKMIARNPTWFENTVATWTAGANRKSQDRWLYFVMDDLCKILTDRDVVLARNPHSAPFGLVLDALTLVRPGITAAQIDSYLQVTRQGVGGSNFGRSWGGIE